MAQMKSEFAFAQFSAARRTYEDASEHGDRRSLDADLLMARTLLKIDEEKAVPFLLSHRVDGGTEEQVGLWLMYLGIGYARLRDYAEADKNFEKAAVKLPERKQSELAYQRARRFLLELNTESAWAWLKKAEADKTLRARLQSEHLRSFIFGHEEKYREQAQSLMRVLDTLDKHKDAFLEIWYTSVHTLAVLSRELPLPAAAARAQAEIESDTPWSEDFAVSRFQALKAIGWCRALEGDNLGCFRFLRQAQRIAPGPAWSMIVLLDRSYFARTIGETQWSENELAAAEEIAKGIDWNACNGEERIALLLLAELVSWSSPGRGTFYLARYNNLDKLRSSLHHFAFDKRMNALTFYASGIVKQRNGEAVEATEVFRKAWSDFDRIGYDWRAARSAMRLFELTGKERWKYLAEEKLEQYPQSWLNRELDASKPISAANQELTPAQFKIFQMICSGMSTEEIAGKLGRSQHTLRNHLKLIFKAYGVKTRAALVAEAARRGQIQSTFSAT